MIKKEEPKTSIETAPKAEARRRIALENMKMLSFFNTILIILFPFFVYISIIIESPLNDNWFQIEQIQLISTFVLVTISYIFTKHYTKNNADTVTFFLAFYILITTFIFTNFITKFTTEPFARILFITLVSVTVVLFFYLQPYVLSIILGVFIIALFSIDNQAIKPGKNDLETLLFISSITVFSIFRSINIYKTKFMEILHMIDLEKNAYELNNVQRNIKDKYKLQSIELRLAKEKAEESEKLKTAFLSNLSHEIRTPMNGILGFSSLLNDPEITADEKVEYVNTIQKSGARMLNILNEIVEISRIDSKVIERHLSMISLNQWLDQICLPLIKEAEAKNLVFIVNNQVEDKQLKFVTDDYKLSQVITNLLKNAIKYTDQGSVLVGCSLIPSEELTRNVLNCEPSEKLLFFVEDTGIGIPVDRQEAIFERFIQADIYDIQARQGAGLGLSIAKAFVELMGGDIWVESQPNQGSTFYFSLPMIKEIPINK